jgi:SAM-dependent methyltransferase
MKCFCASGEEAASLAARLKSFYNSTSDYGAFHAPSHQIRLWKHAVEKVREMSSRDHAGKIRILEAGAGRSGLARFLKENGVRDRVLLHAQDVTSANREWLQDECDEFTIGTIEDVTGQFDAVLSTYVLEHVTNPAPFLSESWKRVAPGGSMFLTCPRYDLPFYLARSADHLGAGRRLALGLYVMWLRARTWMTRRPAWLVHKDPAVFHLPFFRDRDAVHWVSWFDLRAYWPDIQPLKLDYRGFSEAIRIRCLTVAFRRDKAARQHTA